MPINASFEFERAKMKYEQAKSMAEKIAGLQEMRSTAPSHKGAENLRAEITSKIAKLKKEMEKQRQQEKKSSGYSINVKKEGAGQVAIMGLPNTGKSTLLKLLTGIKVEIAPYPFTTTKPEVGMMDFKGAKVQLVEVPAIIEGSSSGKADGTRMLSLARNADALVITYREEKEKETAAKELENVGIIVSRKKPKIFINESGYKGITISGKKFLKMPEKQFGEILKGFHVHNASVLLEEEATKEKILEALNETLEYKGCLFLKTGKWDSSKEEIKQKIFLLLGKIIIYTKRPGLDPDLTKPLVLGQKATVNDVAAMIHKEIAKNLKYVRVWGSTKFAGQRVSKDYRLQNGDIIEISA